MTNTERLHKQAAKDSQDGNSRFVVYVPDQGADVYTNDQMMKWSAFVQTDAFDRLIKNRSDRAMEFDLSALAKDAERFRFIRDNPESCPAYYGDGVWMVIWLNKGSGPEAGVCSTEFHSFVSAVDFVMHWVHE